MKRKKGLVLREVCGQNVILGEGLDAVDFSNMIAINGTSAFLFEEAGRQENFTAESLAESLVKEYDVEIQTAIEDTREILSKWLEIGVIEQ